jgi:hypothetical protein
MSNKDELRDHHYKVFQDSCTVLLYLLGLRQAFAGRVLDTVWWLLYLNRENPATE